MGDVIRVQSMIHRKAIARFEAACEKAVARLQKDTKEELTGAVIYHHASMSPEEVFSRLIDIEMEDYPCG